MNKFLRTASTPRLLATLAGFIAAIAAGTAIAVAAQGGGPVPKQRRLAVAIHNAMDAQSVNGISADVSFTNRLIDTAEIQGTDPLLSGGQGHVWISSTGQFRLELYGNNGDPAVVVNKNSWWVSDPMTSTVYKGTLSSQSGAKQEPKSGKAQTLPTISQIQTDLNQLAQHLNVSGAIPTDVGGQPTYTVKLTPKQRGGLIGGLQLAWDALRGVPLRFAVYARGDSTPVLELAATNVTYGSVDPSVFKLSPPTSGFKTVTVAMPTATGAAAEPTHGKGKKGAKRAQISGVSAVARHLSFKLVAPTKVAGMSRQSVTLLGSGRDARAMLVYGRYLGGVAVIEQAASGSSARQLSLSSGSGDHAHGISLPTFSVHGNTAQELDTAIGTFVRFTSGGVTYAVVGSVTPRVARAAARGL